MINYQQNLAELEMLIGKELTPMPAEEQEISETTP
jgi:hypothetical protein